MKKGLFGAGLFVLGGMCGIVGMCKLAAMVIDTAIDNGIIDLKALDHHVAEHRAAEKPESEKPESEKSEADPFVSDGGRVFAFGHGDNPPKSRLPENLNPSMIWPWGDDAAHFPSQDVIDRQMPLSMMDAAELI